MDLSLFQAINFYAGKYPVLDSLAVFFAQYFEYFILLILVMFIFVRPKMYAKMAITALTAAVFARFILVELIRLFLPRPRPFMVQDINLLVNPNQEWAFPSGHAAFYFAVATVVYQYHKMAGILFYLFAFIICFARVFVGLHWPSDIVVGALVGIFVGWLGHKVAKRLA